MAGYYFRLPSDNDLNPAQKAAVFDENAIALSGGPGTGKSVVSLWRHILNHGKRNPVKSQLLTHTTSLALYLKECARTKNDTAANYVDSAINWVFDNLTKTAKVIRAEIIHDEAQDLPLQFNNDLALYTNKISYGADDQQLIAAECRRLDGSYDLEKCSPEKELQQQYNHNSSHVLTRNYRNSKRIMQFAKQIFKEAVIPQEIINSCKTLGEFPTLIVTGNNRDRINNTVLDLVKQFSTNEAINIGILVPLERPAAAANNSATVEYHYKLLQGNGIDCSKYSHQMKKNTNIKNIHVTTFKSAKGLEFDVVIIPDFHLLNEKFRVIDWHDYYVGVTRTKSNLFLISRTDLPNLASAGNNKVIDKVII